MSLPVDLAARARPGAVWAFDVDGTLIGSIRSTVLRPGAVDLLRALHGRGVRCVLWSAGGDDYAWRMARRHGIAEWFDGCYAKAERNGAGRYEAGHFTPDHAPDVFVDDSPVDLPHDAVVVAVPQFLGGSAADTALVDLARVLVQDPA